MIKQKRCLNLPVGDARLSLIDNRDIAAVADVVLTNPGHEGKIYTLTGSEALGLADVAAILSQASGVTISYDPDISINEATRFIAEVDSSFGPSHMVRLILETFRIGAFADVEPDTTQLLGHPQTTFAEFAREYAVVWQ